MRRQVLVREVCPECRGDGYIVHPAWKKYWRAHRTLDERALVLKEQKEHGDTSYVYDNLEEDFRALKARTAALFEQGFQVAPLEDVPLPFVVGFRALSLSGWCRVWLELLPEERKGHA